MVAWVGWFGMVETTVADAAGVHHGKAMFWFTTVTVPVKPAANGCEGAMMEMLSILSVMLPKSTPVCGPQRSMALNRTVSQAITGFFQTRRREVDVPLMVDAKKIALMFAVSAPESNASALITIAIPLDSSRCMKRVSLLTSDVSLAT